MLLSGRVFSEILDMETGLTVLTPRRLNKPEPYRCVYLLHGLSGSHTDWTNYSLLPLYADDYNIIFIMPEAGRSFYADMKYGLKYFSYITEELPAIIKKVFNISAQKEDTSIVGNSMGGYGALRCALSKPEQYGYVCSFSSPCLFLKESMEAQKADDYARLKAVHGEQLLTDFKAIFGEELGWSPDYEILELAKKVSLNPERPRIYCACGTEDYLHEENARFAAAMGLIYKDFTYEEWGGKHDWLFFNEALAKALQFISK